MALRSRPDQLLKIPKDLLNQQHSSPPTSNRPPSASLCIFCQVLAIFTFSFIPPYPEDCDHYDPLHRRKNAVYGEQSPVASLEEIHRNTKHKRPTPLSLTPSKEDFSLNLKDCSLKIREPDVPAPWFLDPGGWSKTAAVSLYFIFPGICTLSLDSCTSLILKFIYLEYLFLAFYPKSICYSLFIVIESFAGLGNFFFHDFAENIFWACELEFFIFYSYYS
ncbi:hypothetical protein STEG23_038371 [Scotinomys teguina]